MFMFAISVYRIAYLWPKVDDKTILFAFLSPLNSITLLAVILKISEMTPKWIFANQVVSRIAFIATDGRLKYYSSIHWEFFEKCSIYLVPIPLCLFDMWDVIRNSYLYSQYFAFIYHKIRNKLLCHIIKR